MDIFKCVRTGGFPGLSGIEYTIVPTRDRGAKGACVFVMRDIWRVEGETFAQRVGHLSETVAWCIARDHNLTATHC